MKTQDEESTSGTVGVSDLKLYWDDFKVEEGANHFSLMGDDICVEFLAWLYDSANNKLYFHKRRVAKVQ